MTESLIIGTAVTLAMTGVDTDQIVPAQFLSRLEKTGFEDALFFEWRKDPDFVLNSSPAADASVLFAGSDFAIGSSREHAVWALLNWGFRAVFAPSFGDIFRTNAGECGLLCGVVNERDLQRLNTATGTNGSVEFTVRIEGQQVAWGDQAVPFTLDARAKQLLLSGGDAISQTLTFDRDLVGFEGGRSRFKPRVG